MRIGILFLTAALLLASCSSTSTDDEERLLQEELVGSWSRVLNQTQFRLTLNQDKTFSVSYDALAFEGTYDIDTNGLLVVEDSGCGNFIGVYSVTVTMEMEEQMLNLGFVEDDCRSRRERWHGTWSRAGMEP